MENLQLSASQKDEQITVNITFKHECVADFSQHRLREDGYASVLETICQQIKYDLSQALKPQFDSALIALETSNTR